jgi:uncharacterized protein
VNLLRALLVLVPFALACAPGEPTPRSPAGSPRGIVRAGTPAAVDIAAARERGAEQGFAWAPFAPESFERARRERRFILLDGAAEWCHWCHVMDETTYLDPEVGRLLRDRFVAIRADVDEHPDLAERYGEWGWPATILFSPDAEELGKFRGYLPADELRAILRDLHPAEVGAPGLALRPDPADLAPPIAALPWIAARAELDLDAFYDPDEGSWGRMQKSPLGANVTFELIRAAHGDAEARKRALFTLEKQRALLDPVWGGVYQYSADRGWGKPHYEKLMPYQAANLEAYALGYATLKDGRLLQDAQGIARYLDTFLSSADGAFLVSQDADAGAHDPKATFVDGDVYYRLGDVERRRLGIPRVDDHVYGHENGLAIAAFCALYDATHDPAILARARRAADLVLRTLVGPDGAVRRAGLGVRYLADAASFGRALARLAEATGEVSYKEAAVRVAEAMQRDLGDAATGAFFAHTADPSAAGVFAKRERPFAHNVTAARFFAALARVTGDASYRDRGRRVIAALLTPRALDERGRMLGDLLLALDDVGEFPWSAMGSQATPNPW